jgi:hypothetical protein
MVEESVKEADEFVEQKAEEAARLEKSKQEKKASYGTHIRSRPR